MLKPRAKANRDTKANRLGSLLGFVVSGLLVFLAIWLVVNRQYVVDAVSVWMYAPSSEVEQLANATGFTSSGKFFFYATRPAIESQADFNRSCPRKETSSPILGCYTADSRIYIYNVTDEKLNGIQEVTAAHEMLHAVWARMSTAERATLESQLKSAYAQLNDTALKQRMDYYQRTEPREFTNELHSILGTEVSSLNSSLESYYSRFFNRSTVLAAHDKYSSVYDELYNRANELTEKMTTLASSIQTGQKAYEVKADAYTNDVTAFNQRASSGQFSSQSEFLSERSVLIARLDALNAERDAINADITTYNSYYAEYNSIASQIEGLNSSLDSLKKIEAPSAV